ncbi:tRNA(His) guanylyltransferase [Cryptosporidium felis]|nr:tRNA(His) guanylyltransferase [Cryptosporidium felis]
MACSKYEYIKDYELQNKIIKNCWFVIRVDGHGFHDFTKDHNFQKPNDKRCLDLMNLCAENIMRNLSDIVISYGQSDEFRRKTDLWNRRSEKILTHVVSLFTSTFIFHWNNFFPDEKLLYPPTFDGRIIIYPTNEDIRTYLSWRQVDCHINNLYNTCFWLLVSRKNLSEQEATEKLRYTDSSFKNELLFQEFGVNYNSVSSQFRKGTTIFRSKPKKKMSRIEYLMKKDLSIDNETEKMEDKLLSNHNNEFEYEPFNPAWVINNETIVIKNILKCYCDIIRDEFWEKNDFILK